ncbi:MAG: DNA-3-methyladenine glycosylase [Candidatus Zambryskibacteria bacterium]|nr:DNA-3-methyladenine glycosylase [Candidatus Zambryskibacteria bacterium]
MLLIPQSFFNRKTLRVAEDLIGKYLVRRYYSPSRKRYVVARERITETEAYVGEHDLACHTSRGKTKRNEVMFRQAGTIYVYFTYGMHWMLNIVTEKEGCGTAVLIRGTENISGPARLTKALKIDKTLNGQKLGRKSGLWVEEDPTSPRLRGTKEIARTPRIGVSRAPDGWAEEPYRFVLKKNK